MTNTYSATIRTIQSQTINNTTIPEYKSVTYDLKDPTGYYTVSDEAPQVTFILHGLNGKAFNWSNNPASTNGSYEFVPSKGSIIDMICEQTDCNIYFGRFYDYNNYDSFQLYKLEENSYSTVGKGVNGITNISKHSIVVFETVYGDLTNDFVYNQFNILASKVVNDIRIARGDNKLPKMNLIAHSRGGITSLQYALDHPDLVDSVFSIGTPYVGSTSASINNYLFNGALTSNALGEDDIVNPVIYNDYMDRWNNGYDIYYKDINYHAIGSYSSIDMLLYQIVYTLVRDYSSINQTFENVVQDIFKGINTIVSNMITLEDITRDQILNLVLDVIYFFLPILKDNNTFLNGITAFFDLIISEFDYDIVHREFVLKNDIIVDLPSQLGYDGESIRGYKGFKRYIRYFSLDREYDLTKTSNSQPVVCHNLVARDKVILQYIIKNLNISTSQYLYTINNDQVTITGYIGTYTSSELRIPSTINHEDGDGNPNNNAKTVVAIADGAFANNVNDNIEITSVVIPSGVKTIGKAAFANCPNLTSFSIPSTVTSIDEGAFNGSGITSFSINNNSKYSWTNNLLIENAIGGDVALYVNPNLTSLTIPDDVTTLNAYLLSGNENINTINLNDVKTIGVDCFRNSSITYINNSDFLEQVDISCFINTPWLSNQTSNEIKINNVLLQCELNNETITVSNGITRIADNCFVGSNIKYIKLPSSIKSIGKYAFAFCENIQWILLDTAEVPTIDSTAINCNVIIYVREKEYSSYVNDTKISFIKEQITTKKN